MITIGHNDLRGLIDELLKFARPGGHAHKKLTKYLDQVERNVFIGPKAFKFIQQLVEKLDNIECVHLDKRQELCRKLGTPCPHTQLYRICGKYSQRKPDKIKGGEYVR